MDGLVEVEEVVRRARREGMGGALQGESCVGGRFGCVVLAEKMDTETESVDTAWGLVIGIDT